MRSEMVVGSSGGGIDRRGFLIWSGRGLGAGAWAALAGCGGGDGQTPDDPPLPPPSVEEIPPASAEARLLRRASFGVTAETQARAQALGVAAYVEEQLAYEALDASAIEAEVAERFPLALASPAALRSGFPGNQVQIVTELLGAALLRAYFSPRQLFELMVEFWNDHFNVHLRNGIAPIFHPDYQQNAIRAHALGRFDALLLATARSPAMLYYLDNFLNFAASPQENYARELLELHTLGVDGGYGETDVKEVARCFTGWTIDRTSAAFVFEPALHDDGPKTVLGTPITRGGAGDGEQVLELLAAHPSTARFIATKLARRFVADTPPPALVEALRQSFVASGGDLRACLRTLFAHPEFTAVQDAKLPRPTEFLGQLVRNLAPGGRFPAGDAWRPYFAILDLLAQIPYYWATPDGYPDLAAYWGGTSGLLNRWRVGLALGLPDFAAAFDPARAAGAAQSLSALVSEVEARLLYRPLAAPDRQRVLDWLVAETGADAEAVLAAGTRAAVVPALVALLVSSPYFQLR
ncbi:MAG: DUF1800 domain-containing protein [Pseudomonadota bacterium]